MAIDTTHGVGSQIGGPTTSRPDPAAGTGPSMTSRAANEELRLAFQAERCGSDVVRLLDDPLPVIAAVVGMGFETVRVRNGATIAGLDDGAVTLETREGALVFRTAEATFEFDTASWSVAFLRIGIDGERSMLIAYDDRGAPSLEIVLDRSDLEALAEVLPRLEHDDQRPSRFLVPEQTADPVVVSELDLDRLTRHWRRRSSWEDIRRLQRGFRVDRRQLIATLARETDWAMPLDPDTVADSTGAIASGGLECVVETAGAGAQTSVATDDLRTPAGGRVILAVGDNEQVLVDPRGLQSAFIVHKPCRDGLETALEGFDDEGNLQVRIRLADGAALHERLTWRSQLARARAAA